MQFELASRKAKLAHFNARSEVNGEDRTPAADIKLELPMTADDLAMFGPDLRHAWYDETNGAARLRNPKLQGPFGWDEEIVGATLTIHIGLGGKGDLSVSGCVINGFKLEPQDGGIILAALRVQCHPSGKDAGRIYELVQADVNVSLAPAQAELPV